MGGDKSRVDIHYQRSLAKSGGRSAGPYVAYAQAVCIPAQDLATFTTCLVNALGVDVQRDRGNRLVNLIYQRKARYLLNHAPEFFADLDADVWGEW